MCLPACFRSTAAPPGQGCLTERNCQVESALSGLNLRDTNLQVVSTEKLQPFATYKPTLLELQAVGKAPSTQEAYRIPEPVSYSTGNAPKSYDESSYSPEVSGASCGLCSKLKEVFSGGPKPHGQSSENCLKLPGLPKPNLPRKQWAKTADTPTSMPWPLMDSFSNSSRKHLRA